MAGKTRYGGRSRELNTFHQITGSREQQGVERGYQPLMPILLCASSIKVPTPMRAIASFKSTTNGGPSVQIHGPMGDTSHSDHHRYNDRMIETSDSERKWAGLCWGSCVLVEIGIKSRPERARGWILILTTVSHHSFYFVFIHLFWDKIPCRQVSHSHLT